MLDQTDSRLQSWIENLLPGTPVSLAAPGAAPTFQGISLYLIALDSAPPPRAPGRPPLQFTAVYLVSVWGHEPAAAHRLLGELVFAALDNPEMDVDLKPLPYETWLAFGVPPQPAFVLRALVRQPRPEPEVHYVRQPLVLRTTGMTELHGVVLGPGDVPLVGARVELPSIEVFVRTDAQGRFRFSGVPAEPRAKHLRVKAKGRELHITVEEPTTEGKPVVIRFDLFKP